MGIGSLFGLNLSLLAEVIRMLFDGLGKKGKPAKGVVRLLCRLGSLRRFGRQDEAPAAVLWRVGFRKRYRAQLA